MPFLALLSSPFARKAIMIGLALVALCAAYAAFVHHERRVGAEQLVAKEQARAREVGEWVQSYAVGATQKQQDLEKQNADNQATVAKLSAPHRGDKCLSADVVDGLRAIAGPHKAH